MLTRAAGGRAAPAPSLAERVIIMTTYEEFMIFLTTGLLIVAILSYTHKK